MPKNTNCALPDQKKFEKLKQEIYNTCQKIEKLKEKKQQQEKEQSIHQDMHQKTTSHTTKEQENKKILAIDKKLIQLDQDISQTKEVLNTLSSNLKKLQNQYKDVETFCQKSNQKACEFSAKICKTLGESSTIDTTQAEAMCLDTTVFTSPLEDSGPSTSRSFTHMNMEESILPSMYPTVTSFIPSAPPLYEDVTSGCDIQQASGSNNTLHNQLDQPYLEPNEQQGQSFIGKLFYGMWTS